jgi:tetratricopeptide (TPR) repeat protein
MEVVPDLGLLRQSFEVYPRRKRIRMLEAAVLDNPSVGTYEELGDLYLDEGRFAQARACYDRAISARTDLPDPFYRRGIAEIQLGDYPAAVLDLEYVVAQSPKYDSHRAAGLLAHAYAKTGEAERAALVFDEVTRISTASETYYNYALFLASQQRTNEAVEWAQRILAKKPTMPGYLRRRERHWFSRAKNLLKKLKAGKAPA